MLKKFFLYVFVMIISTTGIPAKSNNNQHRENSFNADKLEIFNLNADLTINVKNQQGISVSIDGPEILTESIDMDVINGTLRLKQKKTKPNTDLSVKTHNQGQGKGYSMVSINGQTIIVKGSGVTVIESINQEKLRLDISVPAGTPLSFYNLKGDANIGDVLAPLVLTTSGDVHVGRVTKASVNVSKSGDVFIDQVAEKLDLIASENADVEVRTGEVEHLHVQVRNNGNAQFNGKAVDAELSATDNGDVTIAHVVNEPRISASRNADIDVQNRN